MNINLSAKVKGIYDIQINRRSGEVEYYKENENHITDVFIDAFLQNRLSSFTVPQIAIGYDSSIPTEDWDSKIPSSFVRKSGVIHTQGKYVTDKTAEVVFKYDFGVNGFIGSFGDIGLEFKNTSSSDPLFLTFDKITNYLGEPTALDILEGDTLIIYYKLQIILPENSWHSTIGKGRLDEEVTFNMEYKFPLKTDIDLLRPLRAVFCNLVGPNAEINKYRFTVNPYVAGSLTREGRVYFGANHGNGSITTIYFDICSAERYSSSIEYSAVKTVLDTPIVKTSKDKFEITFTYSLGRI